MAELLIGIGLFVAGIAGFVYLVRDARKDAREMAETRAFLEAFEEASRRARQRAREKAEAHSADPSESLSSGENVRTAP